MTAQTSAAPDASRDGLLSVARASANYYVSEALLVVAGLISLPITTRLLSKADYGLLSLVFSTIAVLALIAGMGLGSAAVRLYHEAAARGPAALRHQCEGMITAVTLVGVVMVLLTLLITYSSAATPEASYARCMRLASALILIRAVSGIAQQLLRAQERAAAYARTQVAIRYGTLIVAVVALFFGPRSALTVFAATIAVEAAVLGVLLFDLRRRGLLTRPRLPASLRTALAYGLPLALAGSARFLLDYGDRFVIERVLGLEAVAAYVVPFDFLSRLVGFVSMPMQMAAVPVLYRLWEISQSSSSSNASPSSSSSASSNTASQVLSYTLALFIPVATLYLIFDERLVIALASDKYRGAGELTPYILPAIILDGINFIAIVGMTIRKQTARVAVLVFAAAALNLGLNFVFVSGFGIAGAGIATSLSYAFLVGANFASSRPVLALRVHATPLLSAAAATGTTVAAAALLGGLAPESTLALLTTVAMMGFTALTLQWLLDSELRSAVRDWRTGQAA